MVNVSEKKWDAIKKKLPKNYREIILEKTEGITLRQMSLVKTGETKNPVLVNKFKDGVSLILKDLGYSKNAIKRMW